MKLCELKEVLVGDVNIYERNPDCQEAEGVDAATQMNCYYRDLYTGHRDMIPEGLLRREILLVSGGISISLASRVACIQLKEEPGEGGAT